MTPPGCCSGAHVLDVKKSVISSNSLMWIQERIWQYSLQISLRGKPVRLFFFQMQIGLLTVAVRFLGEEFKRKGNTPLGRIWGVWVILIKWEEGTKDTWRMTPGSRMLHQNWPGQNLMGGGNFYFCRFLTYIQLFQEAGKVAWIYHLFNIIPLLVFIHTNKKTTFVLLTTLKILTVWIKTSNGIMLKRW